MRVSGLGVISGMNAYLVYFAAQQAGVLSLFSGVNLVRSVVWDKLQNVRRSARWMGGAVFFSKVPGVGNGMRRGFQGLEVFSGAGG